MSKTDIINTKKKFFNNDIDDDTNNIDDNHDANNIENKIPNIKTKTKDVVDISTSIQCKLISLFNIQLSYNDSSVLLFIFKQHCFKLNKIIFEGIQLFNIYVLHLCSTNQNLPINSTTIRRCVRSLITGSQKSRSTGENTIECALISKVKSDFFDFNNIDRESDFDNEPSLMKPIEAMCDAYYTNIKEHIKSNFFIYQRRYLKFVLNETFNDELSTTDQIFILYAIQQRINGDLNYIYQEDKRQKKLLEIFDKHEIIIKKIIKNERTNIKNILKTKKITEITVLSKNIIRYIRYFSMMLNKIKKNTGQAFTLLPQFKPKIRFIRYDARALWSIYVKWKIMTSKEIVGVIEFTTNFQKYFSEMFNVKNKFKKILKKYPDIRSINTNGYAISVTFEKLKKITYIVKNKEGIIDDDLDEENNELEEEQIEVDADKKIIKEKYKPKEIIRKDLEEEYNNCIKNKKPIMFDAKEIHTTEEFLKKFSIVGCDIGNKDIMYLITEAGKNIVVNKNTYNDISHQTINKLRIEEHRKEYQIEDVYNELTLASKKTSQIEEYMKYVKIVRNRWDEIWKYCTSEQIFRIDFNSYVYKDMAISRIAQEIIEEIKNKENIHKKYEKYFNGTKYEEDKSKPILIAMGTGNGKMTITNTKNSSGKGPIKKLIKELSKYCVIILTPEKNTSQICSTCEEYLEDIETYKFPSEKKEKDVEKKAQIRTNKEYTKTIKGIISERKERMTEKQKTRTEEGIRKIGYYGESYKIRQCANTHCKENGCTIWQRDRNAGKNITKMMRNQIILGENGIFDKKKKNGVVGNTKVLTIQPARKKTDILVTSNFGVKNLKTLV